MELTPSWYKTKGVSLFPACNLTRQLLNRVVRTEGQMLTVRPSGEKFVASAVHRYAGASGIGRGYETSYDVVPGPPPSAILSAFSTFVRQTR